MTLTTAEATRVASFIFDQMKAANMSPLMRSTKAPVSVGAPAVENPTPRAGRKGIGPNETGPAPAASAPSKTGVDLLHNSAGGTGGATQAKGVVHDSARAGALPRTNARPSSIPKAKPGNTVLAALIAATVQPIVKTQRAVKTVKPSVIKATKEKT